MGKHFNLIDLHNVFSFSMNHPLFPKASILFLEMRERFIVQLALERVQAFDMNILHCTYEALRKQEIADKSWYVLGSRHYLASFVLTLIGSFCALASFVLEFVYKFARNKRIL